MERHLLAVVRRDTPPLSGEPSLPDWVAGADVLTGSASSSTGWDSPTDWLAGVGSGSGSLAGAGSGSGSGAGAGFDGRGGTRVDDGGGGGASVVSSISPSGGNADAIGRPSLLS